MKRRLHKALDNCNTEEEVKSEFSKYFGFRLDTQKNIDLYTPEILFEFKYEMNFQKVKQRAKVIAQTLYYIRRLKYGNEIRTPSNVICVVDKKEAFFIETEKLSEFYYKSKAKKYDWDLAASTPCKLLVADLCESDIIKDIHVYLFTEEISESDFCNQLKNYRQGEQLSIFGDKKEINENNFYPIFKYWESLFGNYVENGRKSSEYFLTDIELGKTSVLENVRVLFRMNSGDAIEKFMPIKDYEYFWQKYSKIRNYHTVSAIRQKMDRMSEISLRRFTGEFFTPLNYVEKALDYLGRTVGAEWWKKGKFRFWDMAAGTGNLEYLLPASAWKYCYISTLLDDDVEYCKKIYPDATVFQYDYLNDDVNILEHPSLIQMGVVPKMPKNLWEDLNNPDLKWIVFINPPYATSNNLERKKSTVNKDNVSMTCIQRMMTDETLGEVSRELFSQFTYRISKEFADKKAYLCMFSKIKYLNSNNDQKLRDKIFNYKYERGFVFSSDNFEGCKAKFPVGFMIWNLGEKKALVNQQIQVDIYNSNIEKYGVKNISTNSRNNFLNKWIDRPKSVETMPPLSSAIVVAAQNKDRRDKAAEGFLASLMCKGNDFANQNYTALLSSPYVSAGALSVVANNFEKAMILHTVRRLPKATWLNDRDQLLQPKTPDLDVLFISDCVIWSLFSGSNQTAAIKEVVYEGKKYRIQNQLFPFLTDVVNFWECVHPDIKADANRVREERFAAKWINEHKLSPEARTVFNDAEELYRLFYKNFNNVNWPKYKIETWDIGWWQLRMALVDAEIGEKEFIKFKKSFVKLGDKILRNIYNYGFLENKTLFFTNEENKD